VVIHAPGKPATGYIYHQGKLKLVEEQPELIRDALAQAIWPIVSYKEKWYRLPD
jgi:hypothetical protein